jgi:two-component system sensor histidine kinase YesM
MSTETNIKMQVKEIYVKIRNYLMNSSIRRKLFLGYLLVTIIPLFIITFYSYTAARDNLINQNYTNMENTLIQTNKNIENKLDTYGRNTDLIYLNSTLKNYLTQNYGSTGIEDAYYYINNYFENILISNTGISTASVYAYNSTLPADDYFIKAMDVSILTEKWYIRMKNSLGGVVYGSAFMDSDKNYVFTVSRYLNDGDVYYPYGILRMTIQEDQLYALIEKPGKDYTNYIADEDGNIISCMDKSLITKSIYNIFGLNAGMISGSGKLTINYKGEKMLVAYSFMDNGWKTISMVPYNSFLSSARKTASFVFLIFSVSLALAVALIYLLSKVLTKRIDLMVKQVSHIQLGNFDVAFKDMGNDEIGKLSAAFSNMGKKLKFLIEDVYQKELQKKQAEMNVLQEQINPHFLYNALASISSLALRNNDKKVNEMSSLLSKFYRLSLSKGRSIMSISDEIELTKYYVEIQKKRFQNLLNVVFILDESLMNYKTPKLVLQPFIENSINHGIWDDERSINITVKLYKQNDNIVFEVMDDGMGMKAETYKGLLADIAQQKEGFGVKNVNKRIKLYFGENYGVNIFSRLGIGTQVKIILPIRE